MRIAKNAAIAMFLQSDGSVLGIALQALAGLVVTLVGVVATTTRKKVEGIDTRVGATEKIVAALVQVKEDNSKRLDRIEDKLDKVLDIPRRRQHE